MAVRNKKYTIVCKNGHVKRVRQGQLRKYVAGRYIGSEFIPTSDTGSALKIDPSKCDTCKKLGLA